MNFVRRECIPDDEFPILGRGDEIPTIRTPVHGIDLPEMPFQDPSLFHLHTDFGDIPPTREIAQGLTITLRIPTVLLDLFLEGFDFTLALLEFFGFAHLRSFVRSFVVVVTSWMDGWVEDVDGRGRSNTEIQKGEKNGRADGRVFCLDGLGRDGSCPGEGLMG